MISIMFAREFQTKINNGLIQLPEEYQQEFNPDQEVKVIILQPTQIREHTAFLNGYTVEDEELYDEY